MKFDLNCDLGEGEPEDKTRRLMRLISSANIACGAHAGNSDTIKTAVRLALEHGVHIGAHPGLPGGFGRENVTMPAADLRPLLLSQMDPFNKIASNAGVSLHHIKLHGALYHLAEKCTEIAEAFAATVRDSWPDAIIYGRAGGLVAKVAERNGIQAWPEAFLDRGYRDDGTLVPRTEPGALLSLSSVLNRLGALLMDGCLQSITGARLNIPARTWCIHSDSPDAIVCAEMARAVFLAFDLTSEKKRALISELTERYEINASSAKVHPALG